jgi:quercetin dioxygenase-like cupin family protein
VQNRPAVKTTLIAAAALLVACSSAGPPATIQAALARGASMKNLEAGRVESLPTGNVYVRFVRFAQPPGYVINSRQHVPSVVYVETGIHRLVLSGEPPIDLVAGQAKFHQSVTHQHLNPGSEPSIWFSIAVWPNSARSQPLVDPIAKAAYESEDIDRTSLPQGAYSQVLRQVTLEPHGTSGAHRFGGVVALYVLSGSVSIKSAHRPALTLHSDEGAAFPPATDLQETNQGGEPVVYIEFLTTPVDRDFEIPLRQPPAA